VGQPGTVLRCVDCGAEADELATGWRAYRAGDLDEDEVVEVLMYCPDCSEREFGPYWWDTPDVL
jgi:DNA-directed RNA polymerase subunit RPC12/RpoP